MCKIFLFITLLFIATCIAACNRHDYWEEEITVHTLSIFTNEFYVSRLQQAVNKMSYDWETTRPNHFLMVELDTYSYRYRYAAISRLQVMLAAEQGPDMIMTYAIPFWDFANAGYLTNIYTLMDPDPFTDPLAANISLSCFFEQPLRAMEISGGLYSFPLGFGFHYVFINTNLPQHIIQRFIDNSTMSLHDMMSIYLEVVRDPEFEHMHFSSGFIGGYLPIAALANYIGNFVNFDSRTADLQNPYFVNFLLDLKEVFVRPVVLGVSHFTPIRSLGDNRAFRNHVFQVDIKSWRPILVFVDSSLYLPGADLFYHARPITDNSGYLLLDEWWGMFDIWNEEDARHNSIFQNSNAWLSICFPAAGNSQLAFEFAQYMIGSRWHNPVIASPTSRELFTRYVTDSFRMISNHIPTLEYLLTFEISDCDDTLDNVLNGLRVLNEMPMTPATSHIPNTLFEYDLDLFMAGNITAEEFARRLQNSITMWLAE